jgi:hypothetical protein
MEAPYGVYRETRGGEETAQCALGEQKDVHVRRQLGRPEPSEQPKLPGFHVGRYDNESSFSA